MAEFKDDARTIGTYWRMGAFVGLWLSVFAALLFIVPWQKRIFDDFGLRLPSATIWIIDASMWLGDYWWETGSIWLVLLAVFARVTFVVRDRVTNRGLRWFWSCVLYFPPLLCHIVVFFALLMPHLQLAEGLRR